MKISKKSWHYRFSNDHGSYDHQARCASGSHTTCSYIRGVANSLFRFSVAVLALCVVAAWAVSILISMVSVPVMIGMGVVIPAKGAIATMGFLCVIGWLATLVGLVFYLVSWTAEKLVDAHDKKVSLLKQAKADKKEGICTLVSFE